MHCVQINYSYDNAEHFQELWTSFSWSSEELLNIQVRLKLEKPEHNWECNCSKKSVWHSKTEEKPYDSWVSGHCSGKQVTVTPWSPWLGFLALLGLFKPKHSRQDKAMGSCCLPIVLSPNIVMEQAENQTTQRFHHLLWAGGRLLEEVNYPFSFLGKKCLLFSNT